MNAIQEVVQIELWLLIRSCTNVSITQDPCREFIKVLGKAVSAKVS